MDTDVVTLLLETYEGDWNSVTTHVIWMIKFYSKHQSWKLVDKYIAILNELLD